MKDTLVLFSKSFPYKREETFLLTELEIIAPNFSKIYIIPLDSKDKPVYELPKNVHVLKIENNKAKVMDVSAFFLFFFYCLAIELSKNFNFKGIIANLRYNYVVFKQSRNRSFAIEKELISQKVNFDSACFYSYWLDENALSLALLKRRKPFIYTIGRGHGYDVFPEQAKYGYNKFQATIIKQLDQILIVSKKGSEFLKKKYQDSQNKIFCSHLGTKKHENTSPESSEKIIIVSCAHIRPVKAIHRIPEVLGMLNLPCEWIHIGAYTNENYKETVVKAIQEAKKKNPFLTIQLLGEMDQERIFNFYKNTAVTLFISLSKNEGIPVSMMEAISFGIPIFSTDVGGCGEICVENITGKRIDSAADETQIALHLKQFANDIQNKKYDANSIKEFWRNNFTAEYNYSILVKKHLK